MMRWIYYGICFCLIMGCHSKDEIASTIELRTASQWIPIEYRVEPYDTLYAIAFRYDQDYRVLAKLNHLKRPYHLWVGQRLRIKPFDQKPQKTAILSSSSRIVKKSQSKMKSMSASSVQWQWPLKNPKIIQVFSPSHGQKGINLTTSAAHAWVYAARSGVIAYAGPGFNHEGYLIIMRHDGNYLTAYAHHEKNLVKEGQIIRTGQIIGLLSSEKSVRELHFEMRVSGKPVDPRQYLSMVHH